MSISLETVSGSDSSLDDSGIADSPTSDLTYRGMISKLPTKSHLTSNWKLQYFEFNGYNINSLWRYTTLCGFFFLLYFLFYLNISKSLTCPFSFRCPTWRGSTWSVSHRRTGRSLHSVFLSRPSRGTQRRVRNTAWCTWTDTCPETCNAWQWACRETCNTWQCTCSNRSRAAPCYPGNASTISLGSGTETPEQ